MKINKITCLLAAVVGTLFTSCAQSYSERFASKDGVQERSQSSSFSPLAGMIGVNMAFFPPQGYGGRYQDGYQQGCGQRTFYGQYQKQPRRNDCRPVQRQYNRPYYGSSHNPIRVMVAQFSDQNPGGYAGP